MEDQLEGQIGIDEVMEVKQMTMQELADKYGTDQGTLSVALSNAGMFRKSHDKNRTYPEDEAAEALIVLYRKWEKDHRNWADIWLTRAHKVEVIYEEGE